VKEHVAGEVRYHTVEHSERAHELFPRNVPPEYIIGWADDECGGRAEALEECHHGGGYVVYQRAGRWAEFRTLIDHGQHRELPAFVLIEAKSVGERSDHTCRGSGVAPLLQANQVVDAHPGERRDFLSAQTRCSPAAAVGQSDVGGLELVAAGAEELGHSRHVDIMPYDPPNHPGPRGTRIIPAFSERWREQMISA
jgi:hypothetical protein